jgi:dTDP-4-dehydrorhamnose 3,5-epimerase-like enzyme
MPESVRIEPLECSIDARGLVFEPLGPAELPMQRNVHVVLTEPGCVRGNHSHRLGTEVTVATGPALFRYRRGDEIIDFSIPGGATFRFTIPPGIGHAFQNTGAKPLLLIGFNTTAHDPAHPDVVRDVLISAD